MRGGNKMNDNEYKELTLKLNSIDIRLTKLETILKFYSMIIPSLTLILGSIIGIIIGHFI